MKDRKPSRLLFMANLDRFADRTPDPLKQLEIGRYRDLLMGLTKIIRQTTRDFGTLPVPEKGAIGAFLIDVGAAGFIWTPRRLDVVIHRQKDGMPATADYIRQAIFQARKEFPCASGRNCTGEERLAQPPCVHAVGRKLFTQLVERCLATLTDEQRKTFDEDIFLEALKALECDEDHNDE